MMNSWRRFSKPATTTPKLISNSTLKSNDYPERMLGVFFGSVTSDGDAAKATQKSCNLIGDEPRGAWEAPFSCFFHPNNLPKWRIRAAHFAALLRLWDQYGGPFSRRRTFESCNKRWGWRKRPSPSEVTEPFLLAKSMKLSDFEQNRFF